MWPFRRKAKPVTPPAATPSKMRKLVAEYDRQLALLPPGQGREVHRVPARQYVERIGPPRVPPGVGKQEVIAALDHANADIYGYAQEAYAGWGFLGYQYLAELSQRPEYRKMSATIATEATRKWIEFTSKSDDDKADRINDLTDAFKQFNVRDVYRRAVMHDGQFGRGQIFIDVLSPNGIPSSEDHDELSTILIRTRSKIKKGSLLGFKNVEPMWTYPFRYNTTNPLASDFYKPTMWFCMSDEVHSSRLLTLVSMEVPDMLKPAYLFGGLALSQIAIPYVENFIRTRDSVGDMLHSYSMSGIATDLSSFLESGAADAMIKRIEIFNRTRDNRGALVLDKTSEEFFQFNTPLSGLDALQAQSLEMLSSVSNIPLVKYTGITPAGLNASSEGEIRVWYDWILAHNENVGTMPITQMMDVVMLHLWGEIDPDIGFRWIPLYEPDPEAEARIRKSDGDRDAQYVQNGVLSPEEVRASLAADPNSGYAGIDVDDVPEPPEQPVDPETEGGNED